MRLLSIRFSYALLIFTATLLSHQAWSQVAIGTGGASPTPNANAVLLLEGNGKQGLIIPVGDRNNVATPVKGMLIFDTNQNQVYYNSTGTAAGWVAAGGGTGGSNLIRINGNTIELGVGVSSSFNLAQGFSNTANGFLYWNGTAWEQARFTLPSTTQALVYNPGTSSWGFQTISAAAGEANTASNVGVGGIGTFKQKTGVNLEFKNINAASNKVTVTNDVANNEVDIDVSPSNLTLSGDISGNLTSATVTSLQNRAVFNQAPNNNDVLKWNNTNLRWEPQPDATGSGALPTLTSNQLISFATGTNVAVNVGGDLDLAVSGTTGLFTVKNNATTGANIINSVNSNTNPSVLINGTQVNPDFGANNISGLGKLALGATGQFAVDPNGNIVKINNITTSFPAAQGGANTFLQNDGAGNLTWASAGGSFSTSNIVPRGNGSTLVSSTIQDNGTTASIGTVPDPNKKLIVSNSTTGILHSIYGLNSQVGAGTSIGIGGEASGSTNTNFGVYGTAFGTGTGSTGVFGSATGTTGINYGIYGTASGAPTNWAGYFLGNAAITGNLYLAPGTAPAPTTDKLYNVLGSLFWNGTNISAGGSGWSFGGNTGTVDGTIGTGTNYIGTKDNVPLNFMVNNTRAGRIDPTLFSAFFGFSSGQNNSGVSNTGLGNFALAQNTSGSGNTAVGASSLSGTTIGVDNTAMGNGALFFNSTGSSNAAFGQAALSNSSTASGNTGMGNASLQFTTTGQNNTALGGSSGITNTIGSNNSFLGYGADATVGNLTKATAIGFNAKVATSNSLVLGGTGVDAVNVGIGTTSPVSKLDVAGDVRLAQITAPAPTTDKLYNVGGSLFWNGTNISAGGSGWGFTGNTGLTDGTNNFIGTTNSTPLNFIVNNSRSGRIEGGAPFNTFLGFQSGLVNTGGANTGFGYQALSGNISGSSNTGVGTQALQNNTTGSGNTAVGTNSLSANSAGGANTALGSRALNNNTVSNNTAMGSDALFTNTTGGDNAAFGVLSLAFNTAARNTGLGAYSLQSNTTGADNAGVGNSVLLLNTTGSQNTALGSLAGRTNTPANANTTGSANTFIGYASGPSTATQLTNATAIGANAVVGASNTIQLGDAAVTTVNVGTGTTAKLVAGGLQITGGTLGTGRVLTSDASGNATWQAGGGSTLINNTGTRNLFAGLGLPTTGTDNAFFGDLAGISNTTGSNNVIMGTQAAQLKTTGDLNTIIGWKAGRASTSHQGNTLVGANAGEFVTTGTLNSFFGERAGYKNTTGAGNTFIGDRAGAVFPDAGTFGNTTGSDNTAVGDFATMEFGGLSNATALGTRAMVSTSNSLVLGSINGVNGATASTNVGIGTTSPGAQLDLINATSGMRTNLWLSTGASIGGAAYVGTNLYRNFSDNVWKYTNTHPNIGGAAIQFNGVGGAGTENDILFVRTNTPGTANTNATLTESMRIHGTTGNISIGGAFTPQTTLDVNGNGAFRANLIVGVPANGNQQLQMGPGTGFSQIQAVNPSVAFNNLSLNPSGGNVGIGTTTPGVPLDIATTTTSIFLSGGSNVFFNSLNGGTLSTGTNPTPQISVRATGAFLSTGSSTNGGFYVTSDERIKRKVGVSDSRNDLATLMKLNITDYKYVDSLNVGNVQVKGVFAQEVEKIYPQAISKQTNWIPNIYSMAERVEFNEAKQLLSITMSKPHGLIVGDKVKLISNTGGEKPSIVAAVDGNAFTVVNWTEKSEKIFVYGKEVNDFRIVDYDRLFTLNLSATQELNKKLEAQQQLIDSLQARDAESKKKIAVLEAGLSKVTDRETELNNLKKQMEEVLRIVGAEAKKK